MSHMLQECSITKTAKVLFDEPTKPHYLMEISRKCQIAHTSVKQHLRTLAKEGILKETTEKKGTRSFPTYTANLDSQAYKTNKKLVNLLTLEESGLIDHLNDKTFPKTIILFGSYSKGEDLEESDIDLFIESKKTNPDLKRHENILKRKIQLHFRENFRQLPEELKESVINGQVLRGYLETT